MPLFYCILCPIIFLLSALATYFFLKDDFPRATFYVVLTVFFFDLLMHTHKEGGL